jgi:hypothetical protein
MNARFWDSVKKGHCMKALLPIAAIVATVASTAQALTLECRVSDLSRGGGYVTELYVFQYDEAAGKALAADGWIMEQFDAPIPAKVTDDTAKKLVFSWSLKMKSSSSQLLKMSYRASYFRDTGKFTVRASPGGAYSNDFEGRGSCKAQ